MRQYYIEPVDSHKSFYNKAKVIVNKETGIHDLISYTTNVAFYDDERDELTILGYWSKTTWRHINGFCHHFNFPLLSKPEYDKRCDDRGILILRRQDYETETN